MTATALLLIDVQLGIDNPRLGFRVTVVEDATATFERRGPDGRHFSAEAMHDAALASLHGEFAAVRTTAQLLADPS